jgi:predicted transcriptional regulator
MKIVTADDPRIFEIREMFHVHGKWTKEVNDLLCEALNSAYADGLASIGVGHVRYRVLRWVAQNEREEGYTHDRIAQECGTTRETVCRTLARLRKTGLIWGTGKEIGYGLTPNGIDFAKQIDQYDRDALYPADENAKATRRRRVAPVSIAPYART